MLQLGSCSGVHAPLGGVPDTDALQFLTTATGGFRVRHRDIVARGAAARADEDVSAQVVAESSGRRAVGGPHNESSSGTVRAGALKRGDSNTLKRSDTSSSSSFAATAPPFNTLRWSKLQQQLFVRTSVLPQAAPQPYDAGHVAASDSNKGREVQHGTSWVAPQPISSSANVHRASDGSGPSSSSLATTVAAWRASGSVLRTSRAELGTLATAAAAAAATTLRASGAGGTRALAPSTSRSDAVDCEVGVHGGVAAQTADARDDDMYHMSPRQQHLAKASAYTFPWGGPPPPVFLERRRVAAYRVAADVRSLVAARLKEGFRVVTGGASSASAATAAARVVLGTAGTAASGAAPPAAASDAAVTGVITLLMLWQPTVMLVYTLRRSRQSPDAVNSVAVDSLAQGDTLPLLRIAVDVVGRQDFVTLYAAVMKADAGAGTTAAHDIPLQLRRLTAAAVEPNRARALRGFLRVLWQVDSVAALLSRRLPLYESRGTAVEARQQLLMLGAGPMATATDTVGGTAAPTMSPSPSYANLQMRSPIHTQLALSSLPATPSDAVQRRGHVATPSAVAMSAALASRLQLQLHTPSGRGVPAADAVAGVGSTPSGLTAVDDGMGGVTASLHAATATPLMSTPHALKSTLSRLPLLAATPQRNRLSPALRSALVAVGGMSVAAWHRWFDVERFEVSLAMIGPGGLATAGGGAALGDLLSPTASASHALLTSVVDALKTWADDELPPAEELFEWAADPRDDDRTAQRRGKGKASAATTTKRKQPSSPASKQSAPPLLVKLIASPELQSQAGPGAAVASAATTAKPAFALVRVVLHSVEAAPASEASCRPSESTVTTSAGSAAVDFPGLVVVLVAVLGATPPARVVLLNDMKRVIRDWSAAAVEATAAALGATVAGAQLQTPPQPTLAAHVLVAPVARMCIPPLLAAAPSACSALPDAAPFFESTASSARAQQLHSTICCSGSSIPRSLLESFLWRRSWRWAISLPEGAAADAAPAIARKLAMHVLHSRARPSPFAGNAGDTTGTDRGVCERRALGVAAAVCEDAAWTPVRCVGASAHGASGEHKSPRNSTSYSLHFLRLVRLAVARPSAPAVVTAVPRDPVPDPRGITLHVVPRPCCTIAHSVVQQVVSVDVVRGTPSLPSGEPTATTIVLQTAVWLEPQLGMSNLLVLQHAGGARKLLPVSIRGVYAALCRAVHATDAYAVHAAAAEAVTADDGASTATAGARMAAEPGAAMMDSLYDMPILSSEEPSGIGADTEVGENGAQGHGEPRATADPLPAYRVRVSVDVVDCTAASASLSASPIACHSATELASPASDVVCTAESPEERLPCATLLLPEPPPVPAPAWELRLTAAAAEAGAAAWHARELPILRPAV